MDITILRNIRQNVASRHKASYENINGKKGWYLLRDDNAIISPCCSTKEEALSALKKEWHKYAEQHLKRCGYRRTYVW